MKIALHAGKCCGIKTIHTLSFKPNDVCYTKNKTSKEYLSSDRYGNSFDVTFNFFWEEAPRETCENRFDRYIEYLERVRHFGLVEVALQLRSDAGSECLSGSVVNDLQLGELESYEVAVDTVLSDMHDDDGYDDGSGFAEEGPRDGWGYQDDWIPVLEKRGFKEVSRFPNVNSGNIVGVYHLIMDKDYYKNKKNKKEK